MGPLEHHLSELNVVSSHGVDDVKIGEMVDDAAAGWAADY